MRLTETYNMQISLVMKKVCMLESWIIIQAYQVDNFYYGWGWAGGEKAATCSE